MIRIHDEKEGEYASSDLSACCCPFCVSLHVFGPGFRGEEREIRGHRENVSGERVDEWPGNRVERRDSRLKDDAMTASSFHPVIRRHLLQVRLP